MSGQEDRHIGREVIRLLMRPVLPACGTMVHRLEEGAKQLRTAAARAASANPAIDSTQPDSGSSAFADPACRAPADTGGFFAGIWSKGDDMKSGITCAHHRRGMTVPSSRGAMNDGLASSIHQAYIDVVTNNKILK